MHIPLNIYIYIDLCHLNIFLYKICMYECYSYLYKCVCCEYMCACVVCVRVCVSVCVRVFMKIYK